MALTYIIEFRDDEKRIGYYTGTLTESMVIKAAHGQPLVSKALQIDGDDYYLTGFEFTPILVKAKTTGGSTGG